MNGRTQTNLATAHPADERSVSLLQGFMDYGIFTKLEEKDLVLENLEIRNKKKKKKNCTVTRKK